MTAQSALTTAADSLMEAGAELERVLAARPERVTYGTRAHAAQLGADSIALAGMLAEVAALLAEEWETKHGAPVLMVPFGGSLSAGATGRFIVLAKSLFLFSRAYQDAMYTLIFEIVEGYPTGKRRMQEALTKPTNPVGRVLREELDGYLGWFSAWRDLRNMVKEGIAFTLMGPSDDLGVNFTLTADPTSLVVFDAGSPIVRLSHFASALTVSAALTNAAAKLAEPPPADSPAGHRA